MSTSPAKTGYLVVHRVVFLLVVVLHLVAKNLLHLAIFLIKIETNHYQLPLPKIS